MMEFRAGLVVDDDGWPHASLHLGTDEARDDVVAAARRKADDDADGFRGIALRKSAAATVHSAMIATSRRFSRGPPSIHRPSRFRAAAYSTPFAILYTLSVTGAGTAQLLRFPDDVAGHRFRVRSRGRPRCPAPSACVFGER